MKLIIAVVICAALAGCGDPQHVAPATPAAAVPHYGVVTNTRFNNASTTTHPSFINVTTQEVKN